MSNKPDLSTAEAVIDFFFEECHDKIGEWDGPSELARLAAARIADAIALAEAWPSLFPAIEHGDSEHRAWLKAKLDEWYRGIGVAPSAESPRVKKALRLLEAWEKEAAAYGSPYYTLPNNVWMGNDEDGILGRLKAALEQEET